MRGRSWVPAALLAPVLLVTGCVADSAAPPEPRSSTPAAIPRGIQLEDITVGGGALDERSGLYICGDKVVASAPAGGIVGDSFVVFDIETGDGDITEVQLPKGMRPNARWLLSTKCVKSGDRPFISVTYQEMPLVPEGGSGVRAAYSLAGEQLWMRNDLNQPATSVDGVLVLGAAPEQPETAVDLRTGQTIATFDPSVQTRTVVAANRMVVRGLSGPPVLTTLTGKRVASLTEASTFTADDGLLFGSTPAELPDTETPAEPEEPRTTEPRATAPGATERPRDPRAPDRPGGGGASGSDSGSDSGPDSGLTDASPSPSPTESPSPEAGSGLFPGEVQAYSLRSGKPVWRLDLAPDPLGVPTVEPETGIVVVVDVEGTAHGIDPESGRQLWLAPTELRNPRVTAASGVVLFDKIDDRFQKLIDARTGLPLPEQEDTIVDLGHPGALQIIDGVPTLVPTADLRSPPTATEDPTN